MIDTISYVDEFLGRFLTERIAARSGPALVTLTGLTLARLGIRTALFPTALDQARGQRAVS